MRREKRDNHIERYEDDIENLSFIMDSLFSQMDAGNWLSRLFDADGVFTTAVHKLIDEMAGITD